MIHLGLYTNDLFLFNMLDKLVCHTCQNFMSHHCEQTVFDFRVVIERVKRAYLFDLFLDPTFIAQQINCLRLVDVAGTQLKCHERQLFGICAPSNIFTHIRWSFLRVRFNSHRFARFVRQVCNLICIFNCIKVSKMGADVRKHTVV